MKFNTIGKKITVSEKITDYLQKKIGKLDKFFKDEAETRVVLSVVKDKVSVEVSIFAGGMIYRAVELDEDVLVAIDKIVDVIERQIRKNKTKLEKKIKREAVSDSILLSGASYTEPEEDAEYKIVKTKRFQVKPMSPEEAVLQMVLLGHSFFVFNNAETGMVNVVYKRKGDTYGLIEPEG